MSFNVAENQGAQLADSRSLVFVNRAGVNVLLVGDFLNRLLLGLLAEIQVVNDTVSPGLLRPRRVFTAILVVAQHPVNVMDEYTGSSHAVLDTLCYHRLVPTIHQVEQGVKVKIVFDLGGVVDGALAMDDKRPIPLQQELRVVEAAVFLFLTLAFFAFQVLIYGNLSRY